MKYTLPILLLCCSFTAYAAEPAATPTQLEAGLVNPGAIDKPAWFKESFLDLRDDLKEASAANKRVVLYFYQDGCPYCAKLIQDNFGKQSITDKDPEKLRCHRHQYVGRPQRNRC